MGGQCDELGGFCECSKSTIYDYETSFMDRSGLPKTLEKYKTGRKSSKEGKRLHSIPLKGARSLIMGFRSRKGHSRRNENLNKFQAMKENKKHLDKGKRKKQKERRHHVKASYKVSSRVKDFIYTLVNNKNFLKLASDFVNEEKSWK